MIERAVLYFGKIRSVLFDPGHFFSSMGDSRWFNEPLSVASTAAWAISFVVTAVIFLTKFLQIGYYLTESLTLAEKILTSPITIVFTFVFFMMTLLIVGGFVLALVLASLWAFAVLLHFSLRLVGGQATLNDSVKYVMYSGAAFVLFVIPVGAMIPAKFGMMPLLALNVLEGAVYYIVSLYLYFLWVIAGERTHKVSRWKAALASVLPLLVLVLFGVLFHAKVFPKLVGMLI